MIGHYSIFSVESNWRNKIARDTVWRHFKLFSYRFPICTYLLSRTIINEKPAKAVLERGNQGSKRDVSGIMYVITRKSGPDKQIEHDLSMIAGGASVNI